ncbi:MAG: hypothetical protein LM590_05655 [Thermofilum sp.]|nr:hypothetical protein [Thermofilum sp.]
MPWTLHVDSEGKLSVDLNGDKNLSITPRDVALLALGLLLHDIAKPYVLGGKKHALLGYEYLEDFCCFRQILKELGSRLGVDQRLLSNLSDDELDKIREVILLHHMALDKEWYEEWSNKISNKTISVRNKLAALFSHPFDRIASSVYGFASEELIKSLSSKSNNKFIKVNPFSRIPIGKLTIQISDKDNLSNALIIMGRDSVRKVAEEYLEGARERTFEPACDIPLYDHGVFTASLSLMLCCHAAIDEIKNFNIIDKHALEKIFKNYISNVKLAWLIVDITGLWSLVERSLKPDDLAGFAYFVNACQESFIRVISEVAVQKLQGCSSDPLLREIAEKVLVPLTRRGSVIISLLPEGIAENIRQAFEKGELIQRVREEVLKTLEGKIKADGIDVDLERILRYSTMISLATADFHECREDEVYACVARRLQEKLVEALRSLSALRVLEKTPEPPKEPCWYCGVNEAVESVDIYYYGGEEIPVKACRTCQHVRMLGKQLVQASKVYAAISEKENIGLIALIPGVKVFYSGWDVKIHRVNYVLKNLEKLKEDLNKKDLNKTIKAVKEDLNKTISKLNNVLERASRASSERAAICIVSDFLNDFIKDKIKIQKLEAIFPLLDETYSYKLTEHLSRILTRILNNSQLIKEYCRRSSRDNVKIPGYLYYDILLLREVLKKSFNSLGIVFHSTEPLVNTLSVIIEKKEELVAPLFMAHPARLMARERFWNEVLKEISNELKDTLIVPESGANYLFVVVPGEQVWEALSRILRVLEKRCFVPRGNDSLRRLSVFGPFTWEVLDVEGPAATLSVFIADGKYPLYRLLRTAFELARMPFRHGEGRYPVRCFLADIRTGFDPAPGAYTLVPLWLFAYLFDAVEGASKEELLLAHRLLLAGGYDKAQEAIAAAVGRGFERGLRGELMETLEIERMRLDPSIYYVLASLINLKRYCQTR